LDYRLFREPELFYPPDSAYPIERNRKKVAQTTASHGSIQPAPSRVIQAIVAVSRVMRDLFAFAARAAATDATVLVTGEPGVGKKVIAKYIHYSSPRVGSRFVRINCAAFREQALTRELFGDPRRDTNSESRDREGPIRRADHGTLFLDHAERMTLGVQTLLLRFVDCGELQSIGNARGTVRINVRIIASTNVDLADRVACGRFRQDLFHRLHVVAITVPPLRERPDDIRPLTEWMLAERQQDIRFSDDAWGAMRKYHWPGNIHELRNVVERLLSDSPPRLVRMTHLRTYLCDGARTTAVSPTTDMRSAGE
jgi:DNA-binding NtrC family response regulator